MKKLIAALLVAVLLVCGCTAAFAKSHGVLTWNEELQRWELQVIDDGPDDNRVNPTPRYEDAFPDGVIPFDGIEIRPLDADTEYIYDFDPALFS